MQKPGRGVKVGAALCVVALLAAACGSGGASQGSGSSGSGSGAQSGGSGKSPSIALSNSYDGNSWRKAMVANFTTVAKQAKGKGLISKYEVVNSNKSSAQQISQLQSMILQGYKAIVIDAASPTALNGVIAKACKAGITVVVFDSLATAPCAYKVESNYVTYGSTETTFLAKQLHGHGNLLEIRGVAGTSVDHDISQGIHQAAAKYPGLKVVGQVHGDWTETVAQKAVEGVLPSLPSVNGVVDQGGDGSGAVKAFQALHKSVPPVIMGNRGSELRVWKQMLAKDPSYQTLSISSVPGMGTIAFWVAHQVATGHKVPKKLYAPLLEIPKDHLNAWLKATPASGVATKVYSEAETKALIKQSAAGAPKYVTTALPG
ncbi:MAG TPA: ABC transporter substrate-binding protein [Acidimicrobiales bacterium]|nr:ABC transporter substrate-binding protein [Acidimicrobiales bacterium]